jgi:glycosyltransferase involved in cell wall biosynthesis
MPDASGKPRLLVLASTYPRWKDDPEPGFVHELAKRLADTFEVSVICPSASGAVREELMDGVSILRYRYAPARLETLVNDGGMVANLKRYPWKWLLVPSFLLSMLLALRREIRRSQPDAVHAHWIIPQGFIAACLGMIGRPLPPLLVTSHGADLYTLRAWPLSAAKRLVVRCAAKLTVVSASMRQDLLALGADETRIGVQPMGVDLAGRFTPDADVPRSRDELLFVGRLVEKKGLHVLIEALPAVLERYSGASLTVAGFGPELAAHQALVARLGLQDKIRFIGAVAQRELPLLYRRAAVFVAPFIEARSGDREGLGLVALEAAGCGCPVIASGLQPVRDAFDGLPVTLVEPGRASELAAAICNVLSAPDAQGTAQEVRSGLLRRFDWEAVSAAYKRLLLGMMHVGE